MNNQTYTQICIPAGKHGANGEELFDLLSPLIEHFSTSFVVASDTDAVGPTRTKILTKTGELKIESSHLYLRDLKQCTQVVWTTLFFCSDNQNPEYLEADEDYTESLPKAAFLARVVDAGYYYLYFPTETAPQFDTASFPGIEYKTGYLNDLDFPE